MVDYVRILAEVPISPLGPGAKSWNAEVTSYKGSKKRKCSEIALAVDNHGVNIYDVRLGSINSSYAVSPVTTFTCPPCSIKISKTGSGEAHNVTYCSVVDPQPRLISFREETKRKVSFGGQLRTSKIDLPNVGVPIVHIECVATHQDEEEPIEIEILCVYEDGQVFCYDQDLTSRKWGAQTASTHDTYQKSPKMHVVQATSTTVQQASRTLLSERADILAALDQNATSYNSHMLLLTTRSMPDAGKDSQASLDLRIVFIRDIGGSNAEVTSIRPRLEQLASLTIPEPKQAHHETSLRQSHLSNGMFYQLTGDALLVYDLTALAPRLVHNIRFPDSMDVKSFIRISSDIVAVSNKSQIFLIGSQFSSFQAMYDLPVSRKIRYDPQEHGDKQSIISKPDASQLLSYHSPSGSAIILQDRSLIAVDVSKAITPELLSRKRKRKALLIDNIGRGSLSSAENLLPAEHVTAMSGALGGLVDPRRESASWKDQKKTLNALLGKGDSRGFDQMMVSKLGNETGGRSRDTTTGGTPQYILDYIIGKMFSTFSLKAAKDSEEFRFLSGLRMHSMYEKSWRHLVRRGLISTDLIEASLRQQELLGGNNKLSHEALIQAVADWDTTLAMVLALLQSSCLIKVPEVCHALKITIARFEMLTTSDDLRPVTYKSEDISLSQDAAGQTQLTDSNTDYQLPQKSDELSHLHSLLDAIIAHCGASSTVAVIKALRSQLLTSELRRILDILRMKLAYHGWLSPYIGDSVTADFSKQYPNNKVSMIAKFLNCVIDSLGTHGWLLNSRVAHDAPEAIESVSYMQAAISAALEGIEEATYLQAMLEELLLCGKSALNSRATPAQAPRNGQRSALPMGLKLDQNISLTKVGAGGEIQPRSQRDIGKLKSRRVPEYSFERIAV
ncbi:MAG: hypothetical protein Q9220_003543 [cf. Caloplaca sp. 1 TL-2023]